MVKKFITKKAFTLAEVLVTLTIIGIIASIIMPSATSDVKGQVLEKSRLVFAQQFRDGLTRMRLAGKLSKEYSSSAEFAEAMKDYFNVAKVCNSNNLKNCFPAKFSAKIAYDEKNNRTEQFNTASIKTSKDLSKELEYNSDVAGVVLNNGFSIIFTYDTNCVGPGAFEQNQNVFTCLDYAADVNGSKSPNALYQDIVTNIQFFDLGFSIEISDTSLSWDEAKNYCESLGDGWKMPDESEMAKIAAVIYTNDVCSEQKRTVSMGQFAYGQDKPCNVTAVLASPAWNKILGDKDAGYFWIDKTSSDNKAYFRSFLKSGSAMDVIEKTNNGIKPLCIK